MTPTELIEIVKSKGNYIKGNKINTGFLIPSYAAREFEGQTLEDSAKIVISYFTNHIDHKSVVGAEVTKSGFPNIDKFKKYLNL